MKKILVILLAICMVTMLLAACDDNSSGNVEKNQDSGEGKGDNNSVAEVVEEDNTEAADNEDDAKNEAPAIAGVWTTTVDATEMFLEEMGGEFGDIKSKFEITILFELNADGSYKFTFDEDALMSIMTAFMEEIFHNMIEVEAADMGMTVDEFRAAFKEELGMDIDEFFMAMLESEINMDELFGEVEVSGTYKVEGDRLYTAQDDEDYDDYYVVFELSGDTLSITGTSDEGTTEAFMDNDVFQLPLVFKRVS